MTDPSDPAQEFLCEFVDAEKACPDPSQEVQHRVLSRLSLTLGLPPDLGDLQPTFADPLGAGSPTESGILGRLLARCSGRGLATFLVGAAVGATIYGTVTHLRRPAAPLNPTTAVIVPVPAEAPDGRPVSVTSTEPIVVEPVGPKPTPTGQHHSRIAEPASDGARDRSLAAERKLVEMARTALTRGQTEGALAALHRHTRLFPHGQLAEERDSLLVQALMAKGEFAQARERGIRFYRQYPQSLFEPVVDQALKSIP
jgi:hypothetical protein